MPIETVQVTRPMHRTSDGAEYDTLEEAIGFQVAIDFGPEVDDYVAKIKTIKTARARCAVASRLLAWERHKALTAAETEPERDTRDRSEAYADEGSEEVA